MIMQMISGIKEQSCNNLMDSSDGIARSDTNSIKLNGIRRRGAG
jgi:hypothetical protein